jgi:hypothetical protein
MSLSIHIVFTFNIAIRGDYKRFNTVFTHLFIHPHSEMMKKFYLKKYEYPYKKISFISVHNTLL